MNVEEKKAGVSLLNEKFSQSKMAILVDFTGMGVEELRAVRGQLRAAGGELKVVKNTIAIRAANGTSLEGLQADFKGATLVALGYADPVAPAKALKAATDKQKKLKIKSGVFEGTVVDFDCFRKIAKLPAKPVLIAQLVGCLQGPISGFAGCLDGVLSKFVRTLQAVHDDREKS